MAFENNRLFLSLSKPLSNLQETQPTGRAKYCSNTIHAVSCPLKAFSLRNRSGCVTVASTLQIILKLVESGFSLDNPMEIITKEENLDVFVVPSVIWASPTQTSNCEIET